MGFWKMVGLEFEGSGAAAGLQDVPICGCKDTPLCEREQALATQLH